MEVFLREVIVRMKGHSSVFCGNSDVFVVEVVVVIMITGVFG